MPLSGMGQKAGSTGDVRQEQVWRQTSGGQRLRAASRSHLIYSHIALQEIEKYYLLFTSKSRD